jgi:hypothetical protein
MTTAPNPKIIYTARSGIKLRSDGSLLYPPPPPPPPPPPAENNYKCCRCKYAQ